MPCSPPCSPPCDPPAFHLALHLAGHVSPPCCSTLSSRWGWPSLAHPHLLFHIDAIALCTAPAGDEFEQAEDEEEVEVDAPRKPIGGKRQKGEKTKKAKGGGFPDSASPKEKKKASAPSNRHQGRSGDGKKYCRGCGKKKNISLFAANQTLDMDCKKHRDNLYKYAQRQGDDQWFKESESNDEKLQEMVAMMVDRGRSSNPKAKIILAQVKQRIEASAEVLSDEVGEMMDLEAYAEFAATAKGGRLSMAAANLKWAQWTAEKDEKAYIYDFKGKNPDSKLQMWVKMADKITFRNRQATIKGSEQLLEEKKGKNIKDGDLENMNRQVLSGAAVEGAESMTDIARKIVNAGLGGQISALEDSGGTLGNIKDMFQSEEEEEEQDVEVDGEDGGMAQGSEEEGDGGNKEKPKKKKEPKAEAAVDMELCRSRSIRMYKHAVQKLEDSVKAAYDEGRVLMEVLEKRNVQTADHYKNA